MPALHDLWQHVQRQLLPVLAEELGPLGAKDEPFVPVVAPLPRGQFLPRDPGCGNGQPPHGRIWLLHAFVAKAVYQFPTTEGPAAYDASNFPARFYRAVSP